MTRLCLAAAAAAFVSAPALAGAQDLTLSIDRTTGDVTWETAVTGIAGFQLDSNSGSLVPANFPYFLGDANSGLYSFSGMDTFVVISDTASSMSGGDFTGMGQVILGETVVGMYDVSGFASDADILGDLTLTYDDPTTGMVLAGAINVVPEPSSLGLLGVAGLALVRRRK